MTGPNPGVWEASKHETKWQTLAQTYLLPAGL